MITRHHVALAILCTLILCGVLVPSDPFLILVISLGACTGAILPDIQMKKPQGMFQIRMAGWIVTRFSSILCTPIICRLYHALSGRTFHFGDKRLTHSVPGILFLESVLSAFLLVPAFIFLSSASWYLPVAFLCGVIFGLVLHLLEDMCTRKGITPLFPFSTTKVSGSIRPCDTTDRRIVQFHFYHCSVAGIIIGFQFIRDWQDASSVPVCIFALASCLGMMIWLSDVSISCEPAEYGATGIRIPVLSDLFTVPGNSDHSSSRLLMGVYYFTKKNDDV
ncbi:MAG: metal-dependent hydrolase [Methanoregula sp.]|nr:metal-dependent hydrolase [Methanoregula sp.]